MNSDIFAHTDILYDCSLVFLLSCFGVGVLLKQPTWLCCSAGCLAHILRIMNTARWTRFLMVVDQDLSSHIKVFEEILDVNNIAVTRTVSGQNKGEAKVNK